MFYVMNEDYDIISAHVTYESAQNEKNLLEENTGKKHIIFN